MFGIDDVLAGIGGVASGGLSLAGSLLNAGQNRQAMRFSADQQENQMKHGLQWRVEDAKRAGIHPLYALGANISSSPIIPAGDVGGYGGLADMGQNIQDVIRRTSPGAKLKEELELKALQSSINETDARKDLLRAQEGKIRNTPSVGPGPVTFMEGSQTPTGGGAVSIGPGDTPGAGMVKVSPRDLQAAGRGTPDLLAGQDPGNEGIRINDKMSMDFPSTKNESYEEIISELNPFAWGGILLRNARLFGGQWLKDYLAYRYLGQEPKNYYPNVRQAREYRDKEWKSMKESEGFWQLSKEGYPQWIPWDEEGRQKWRVMTGRGRRSDYAE